MLEREKPFQPTSHESQLIELTQNEDLDALKNLNISDTEFDLAFPFKSAKNKQEESTDDEEIQLIYLSQLERKKEARYFPDLIQLASAGKHQSILDYFYERYKLRHQNDHFFFAVACNQVTLIPELTKKAIEMARDGAFSTLSDALIFSARCGHIEIVKFFIDALDDMQIKFQNIIQEEIQKIVDSEDLEEVHYWHELYTSGLQKSLMAALCTSSYYDHPEITKKLLSYPGICEKTLLQEFNQPSKPEPNAIKAFIMSAFFSFHRPYIDVKPLMKSMKINDISSAIQSLLLQIKINAFIKNTNKLFQLPAEYNQSFFKNENANKIIEAANALIIALQTKQPLAELLCQHPILSQNPKLLKYMEKGSILQSTLSQHENTMRNTGKTTC